MRNNRNAQKNHKSSFALNFQANANVRNELIDPFRSSRPEVFRKKDVLRNFTKFTGKHLCQVLFSNKAATLLYVFYMLFCDFLRTPFFK